MSKQLPKKLQEWVDALRSGKYKQGTDYLYNPDDESFCCLGVYAKEIRGSTEKYLSLSPVSGGPVASYNAIKRELEKHNLYSEDYISMNDDGKSFQQIANQIEKDWRSANT